MNGPRYPRAALFARLHDRVRRPPPLALVGPPGAGKTTLLRSTADALADAGFCPVVLDLMGAASSPERFARAVVDALPAAARAAFDPAATRILAAAATGKAGGASAVQAVFDLWAAMDEAREEPVALLLDEPTEIRSLAYFAGLREVEAAMWRALSARRQGTLLVSSYPSATRRLWPDLEQQACGPLDVAEIQAALDLARVRGDAPTVRRATGGWPRALDALLASMAGGRPAEEAWAREMALGGTLERACRSTYEVLLLRSRGYGMSKAVLQIVAAEEGLNLTAIMARLGRTPGAVRDYLGWLLAVDVLRMDKKRYSFVDPLVGHWVRLHGRGVAATGAEIRAAAARACAPPAGAPAPEADAARARAARSEGLMEID